MARVSVVIEELTGNRDINLIPETIRLCLCSGWPKGTFRVTKIQQPAPAQSEVRPGSRRTTRPVILTDKVAKALDLLASEQQMPIERFIEQELAYLAGYRTRMAYEQEVVAPQEAEEAASKEPAAQSTEEQHQERDQTP